MIKRGEEAFREVFGRECTNIRNATDNFLHLETHLKLIKAEATKRKLERLLNIHEEVSGFR